MRCYSCDTITDNKPDKTDRVYCDFCSSEISETIYEFEVSEDHYHKDYLTLLEEVNGGNKDTDTSDVS